MKKAKKQRKGCLGSIFSILLLIIIAGVAIGYLKKIDILDGIEQTFSEKEENIAGETKEVSFLNLAHCSERKVLDEQSAKEALLDMQDQIGFESLDEFSEAEKSITDTYTFYKFDQLYQGIPVIQSSLFFTVGTDGKICNVTGNYTSPKDLSIEEVLLAYEKSTEVSVKEDAEYIFYDGKKKSYHFSYADENTGFLHGEDFYCFELDEDGKYIGEVKNNQTEYWYKVKKNGKEGNYYLSRNESTAETKLYEGEQLITDSPRYAFVHNAEVFDASEMNGENEDATKAGLIVQDIYDFYQNVLFRNGYDGKDHGLDIILNVKKNTTGWNGQCVSSRIFGQTAALLLFENEVEISHELIGHEYNHAVMKSICNVNYDNFETGTIEEGLCDVFGEFIEDYADNGILDNSCDWLHTVRDIGTPELSKNPSPSVYSGDENWYKGKDHSVFVHQNSTVISHTLYKMSEGIVEDENSSGMGNEKLAKLLYYAYHTIPHDCSIYQFGTILRTIAYNMCQDGLLSKEQARCVYQALLEAKIYPYYEVSADTQIAFYNLNGSIIDEYTLNIEKELSTKSITERETDSIQSIDVHAEKCQLNVKDNAAYLMSIRLKEGEEYPFLVSTKKQKNAEQVIEEYNIFTDIMEKQNIVNNGERYVSLDGNTYYWKYNKNSLEATGVNGGFRNQNVKNQLVVRNQSGVETILLEDVGYGELYIAKKRLYYKTSEGWKSCLLDGTDGKKHPDYNIQTVDASTGNLILRDTINLDPKRKGGFWTEKEDGSKTLLTTDKFDLDSKLWPELLLAEGGNLYYYRVHDNKNGSHNITVLGANMKGETRLVGNITIDRNGCEGLEVWGQLLDGTLYVGFTNVGGTMMNCNQGGVSSMDTQKDEAHTYIIRQDGEYSLYYPATHISVDSETGEKMLHFYNGQGMGGTARERWVASRVQKMNLETKEVTDSDLPLMFTGEYALVDGDIVTVLEGADETSILATQETLAGLGYFSFDGNERSTGGFKISDVTVVGNKAYIEIHQFTRAKEADIGYIYGFRRIKTVVYETEIGSDELSVLYKY